MKTGVFDDNRDPQDALAENAFLAVRDIPYRLAEYRGDEAANCGVKGAMLISKLGALGIPVRGRVAEMAWEDQGLPRSILRLYPQSFKATHFYVEMLKNEQWVAIDPSVDEGLAGVGDLKLVEWNGENRIGIPCRGLMDFEEHCQYYLECWHNYDYVTAYFEAAGPFLKEANLWLEDQRRQVTDKKLDESIKARKLVNP